MLNIFHMVKLHVRDNYVLYRQHLHNTKGKEIYFCNLFPFKRHKVLYSSQHIENTHRFKKLTQPYTYFYKPLE